MITHPFFSPGRMVKCSVSVPLMRTVGVILLRRSLRIVVNWQGNQNKSGQNGQRASSEYFPSYGKKGNALVGHTV